MKLSINASSNELFLYGVIGPHEISAKSVVEQLKALDQSKTIKVHITSSGGDVMEGIAIYNAIKDLPDTEIYIDGLAASMGSVIAMAGKKVFMAENAFLMIHNPWVMAAGDSDDLRESADTLDKIKPSMIAAYTSKSGKPDAEIEAIMKAETWFNAQEALEAGFIDSITEEVQLAASIDLSKFENVPTNFQNSVLNEQQRVSEINSCAKIVGIDPKPFIQSGVSIEEAQAQMMKELGKDVKPVSGNIVMSTDNLKDFLNDAEDAILLRNGIKPNGHSKGAEALAKYSAVGLAEKFLGMHGVSVSMMDRQQILNKALEIKAQHSTGDFAHLLGNTAGKSLRMAYEEEQGSHEEWTGTTEVQDFKDNSLVQLSEAPSLDLVKEGAEYKHGSFGNNSETFRIAKYGKLFSITYEALINDDLGAFTRLPMAFGKSAKHKEADLVYEVLTKNPKLSDTKALFHTDHGNLLTSRVLNVDNLGAARLAMRTQKGADGKTPINVVPKFLIVPAALETIAEQLLASVVDPAKNNDTVNPAFVRGLTLVVDSRLDADSDNCWYLASDPNQVDTITRAYLAGSARPYYEVKDGWEVDGMSVKSRLEVAAVPVDYRGLVKVAG